MGNFPALIAKSPTGAGLSFPFNQIKIKTPEEEQTIDTFGADYQIVIMNNIYNVLFII
ncbi:hypothetical protein ACFPMF_21730 [Larkinella bovis]|uniref:Uncharacterized protein n=1 Tax=Larkinella bovis TaxID=683041 RepID=A0ABW0IHU1_9BACT